MRFKEFSESYRLAELDDPYRKAKQFIDDITTSSRIGVFPDEDTLQVLSKTVDKTNDSYVVYRGLALKNISTDDLKELSKLNVGDYVPNKYLGTNGGQLTLHTTLDKDIADSYSQGGDVGIVFSITTLSIYVIVDMTSLDKIFDMSLFSDEQLKYFKKTKEVLLYKNQNYKAVITKIKK